METKLYDLKVKFITPVLGTQPQRDIAEDYLGAKYLEGGGMLPDDELETLPEMLEKGTTAFHKENGLPIYYDYQVKGMIKEAGRIFNGLNGVKALRSKVENLVFIKPRRIPLIMPEGSVIDFLERPLRAETPLGPRIAIARSEVLPEGTWFECKLEIFKGPIDDDLIRDLLSYGEYKGLGQWRNGGWGRFEFELSK